MAIKNQAKGFPKREVREKAIITDATPAELMGDHNPSHLKKFGQLLNYLILLLYYVSTTQLLHE